MERRRQDLTSTESSDEEEFQVDHIKVGSYYEIDHSKLPPSSPVQLQIVKIVMVCGKNNRVISVRYPSIFTLKSYFRSGTSGGVNESRSCTGYSAKMQKAMKSNPALDEKYAMVYRVAALVLFRHIKPEEFVKSRGSMSFWAAGQSSGSRTRRIATRGSSSSGVKVTMMASRGGSGGVGVDGGSSPGITVYQRTGTKTGECLSALKSGKVASWGTRQKVRYISNCDSAAGNDSNPQVITPPNEDKSVGEEQLVKGKEQSDDESSEDGKREELEEEKEEEVKQEVKEEDEDESDDKAASDVQVKSKIPPRRNRKRKCKVVSYNQQNRVLKKPKTETIVRRKTGLTRGQKRGGHKESINRWSADRYKLAEKNIWKIMKEKGAVFEKPILRQKLRDEARKMIGDTGLLDHLLKHMAGKVAPGGEERFQRHHNAEGAMEYWLESADLIEIRKMAGVSDPYWNPPPGWKLGDNPSQDPVCTVEIRQLKEEVDKLKRGLNELQMTKRPEEAEILATTLLSCVSEQNLIIGLEVLPLKESHEELAKRKFRLEQQMIKVSHYLTEMEEEMEKLSKVVKTTTEGSDGTAGCLTFSSQKNEAAEGNNDNCMSQTQLELMDSPGKHSDIEGQHNANTSSAEEAAAVAAAAKAEEKAAKIQRLKSGFKICKPQASFKWPNIAAAGVDSPAMPYISSISSSSSQILSPPTTNLEYFLAAQTPPSVSSTTTKSPSLPILTQPMPVKPVARRLAAAAAAISIPSYSPSLIDLNHAPRPAAAHTNWTDSTGQHYGANIPAIYSHSQRSNQNLALIPPATASKQLQGKYSMNPRLAAETSRHHTLQIQAHHLVSQQNTWVPVPIPEHLLSKFNQ